MLPQNIYSELYFKAVRSSGKGGQNVNKVSTKVELYFNILDSNVLTYYQKNILQKRLQNKLTSNGILRLYSQDSRSQFKNKKIVIAKFYAIIEDSLKKKKIRLKSSIPKGIEKRRLDNKRLQSQKKANRKKIILPL